MRRDGFTLIEVLAAIALAGVLAALAFASLAGPAKAARLEDQVGRLVAYDAAARAAGRSLTFDRQHGVHAAAGLPPLRLDAPFTVASVVTAAGSATTIAVSPAGRSVDYAVQIVGGGAERWVLFLGMTGRPTELADADAVRSFFDAFPDE